MENSVTSQLQALKKLQEIDSQLVEIKVTLGTLPEEACDLEDEIEGFATRQAKLSQEAQKLEGDVADNKEKVKEAEGKIQYYEKQQENVRNDREYNAISKEVELQKLEIQLLEQRRNETYQEVEKIGQSVAEVETIHAEKEDLLERKKKELQNLEKDSLLQEQGLEKKRKTASKNVDERLLGSYEKIRKNVRNGLALVSIRRDACGGCFNVVPPQQQANVREQKKILVCHHCGRILCDVIVEPKSKPESSVKKATRAKKSTKKATK